MVSGVEAGADGLTVNFTAKGKEGSASGEKVLCAIGRRPYYEGLFTDGLTPEFDGRRIKVNERYETSLPGIYAIGDVTGGVMLAHAAAAEGRNAVREMNARPDKEDMRWIPSCIYTEPEIASVGMTADEAKEAGIEAESRKVLMGANGRTVITGGERGFIRVVYEKETGKLLGAQMMCERATDLISEFTQALSAGQTVQDLARVIRPHPTFSEAISEAVRIG
jgi:dihydrolipoamide dehydrogenase